MMKQNYDVNALTRLSGYMLTAGAAGLASGSVGAAVMPINVTTTVTANGGSASYPLDVDGDLTPDFTINASHYVGPPSGGYVTISIPGPGTAQFYTVLRGSCSASDYYAGNVAQGTTVNAALLDSNNYSYPIIWASNRIADCNNFVSDQWGRLAFRFDPAGGTNWRYGYLNVRQRVGSTELDINGGEYQSTAGASLLAGSPLSVPVGPAVPVGIGLLIAGAAALRHRRQKKLH